MDLLRSCIGLRDIVADNRPIVRAFADQALDHRQRNQQDEKDESQQERFEE